MTHGDPGPVWIVPKHMTDQSERIAALERQLAEARAWNGSLELALAEAEARVKAVEKVVGLVRKLEIFGNLYADNNARVYGPENWVKTLNLALAALPEPLTEGEKL